MNYYISDLHIGHSNVIKFDDRPFKDIDEMFQTILTNWNNTVTNKDTVYIIGDFIWDKENQWYDIVKQFKGHKVLIKGNHDPKQFSHKTKSLFLDIKDYAMITDGANKLVLSHYPIICYPKDYFPNVYMLYGHVHSTREMDYVQQARKIIRDKINGTYGEPLGQLLHVGCMEKYMDYTPRTLDEIIKGDAEAYPFERKENNVEIEY